MVLTEKELDELELDLKKKADALFNGWKEKE